MRAIYFERNGGHEILELIERPSPTPGEARCSSTSRRSARTTATCMSAGYGSAAPTILGVEGAGRVYDTGERVA
jgi:NADPH:quinone reductase-like Zn-dependent oxidoreductase